MWILKNVMEEIWGKRYVSYLLEQAHTQWIRSNERHHGGASFCEQVLPPDVFTKVTMGKYAAGLIHSNDCSNISQSPLIRL